VNAQFRDPALISEKKKHGTHCMRGLAGAMRGNANILDVYNFEIRLNRAQEVEELETRLLIFNQ
jgi:hypothetical protein